MQPIPKTPPPQDGADEDGTIAVGFPYMGGFGGGQAIDPAEMPSPAGLGDSMRFTGSQCVLHHPPPPSPAARLVEKGRSEGPRRTRCGGQKSLARALTTSGAEMVRGAMLQRRVAERVGRGQLVHAV